MSSIPTVLARDISVVAGDLKLETFCESLMLYASSLKEGRTVVEYEAPRPEIGIHRYVFVLFQQQQRLGQVIPLDVRSHFNTRGFAQQYGLGPAVAAVYFNAQRGTANRRR